MYSGAEDFITYTALCIQCQHNYGRREPKTLILYIVMFTLYT
jgi:hypothetical protein